MPRFRSKNAGGAVKMRGTQPLASQLAADAAGPALKQGKSPHQRRALAKEGGAGRKRALGDDDDDGEDDGAAAQHVPAQVCDTAARAARRVCVRRFSFLVVFLLFPRPPPALARARGRRGVLRAGPTRSTPAFLAAVGASWGGTEYLARSAWREE